MSNITDGITNPDPSQGVASAGTCSAPGPAGPVHPPSGPPAAGNPGE